MRHFHRLSQATLTSTLLLGTTLAFAQPKADEGEKKADDEAAEEEKPEAEKDQASGDEEPDASEASEEKSDDKEESDAKAETSEEEEAAAKEDSDADADDPKEETPPSEPSDVKAEDKDKNKGNEAKKPETKPADDGPVASETATEEAADAALTDFPETKPSLTPFTVTTSTFSRFEIREGYEELGVSSGRNLEGDAVFFRARLGLQTNPLSIGDGSDVSIKFNPQASGKWGENGFTGEAAWGLYEGYIHWRSPRLETKLGRQTVTYGDEIIFGRAWWNQVGRALDGIRFRYKMNKGYLDVFGFQPAEIHPDGTNRFLEGDEYVWGAYSGFGGYFDDNIETDLYFIGKSRIAQDNVETEVTDALVDVEGAHLFTAGGRVKHRVGFFDYRLEAGIQFGTTPYGELQLDNNWDAADALAYNFDGEFGFWMGHGTRIGLGGAYVSGDDPTTDKNEGWDHLYPAVHRWLGRMDVIGIRTNVMAARMNVQRRITDDLKLNLEGHVFARQFSGGRGQQPQVSSDGTTENVGTDMAGVEIDTSLRHSLGKFSYVSALYGLFIPSSGHYYSDDLASYGELQAGVEF